MSEAEIAKARPVAITPSAEGVAKLKLAHTLVELADTMVADFDLLDFLLVLVERSVDLLSADAAGLMLADQRGHLRVLASTSEQSRLIELFELQNSEGPCLDSFHSGSQVVNLEFGEAQQRWPLFTPEATGAGFQSVHALPLRLRGTIIGSINLFCMNESRLSTEDIEVGQALADVATIGLLSQRSDRETQVLAETLQEALNSRVIIEQAKGVVSAMLEIDMEQGLEMLRSHAHHRNIKLTAVAKDVISGSLPAHDLAFTAASQRPGE